MSNMSKTATALEAVSPVETGQRPLRERLDCLKGADAASTEFIRTGLSAPSAAGQADRPEAEDRVRRFLANNASDSPIDIVILLGSGQPDEMDALLRLLPDSCKILLLENDAARIAGLFRSWPLETAVQKGKIVLALGTDREHIHARFFGLMDMQRPPNVCFCDVPETTPEAGEFYTSVLKKIRELVHLTIFNLNTLLDRGPLWQYNTIKNLPHLLTHPGIATLAGLFAGRPAIVVGAG
ncbi:MAG: motility associated factor glycosyltransferase family protein, partial [Lentisphaerae bacterium]|nr:motility associated factor glycosyltransferase family protein [Lentisphaerota bacterium]